MLRLKELRNAKGFTQQYIADILQISRAAYTNIENGKRDPDTATLTKLANVFGVSVDYLLGRGETSSLPHDPETVSAMEEAFERPEMRALFSVSKNATKEDIEKTIAIIKALKGGDCAE
ncbi:helix-turn-helix domain-containing protein [Christensenella minuta]|uniref:helix-turn-helix domain-containing protein n=1 Tax=Christensenella minuta TaxID=626937 RepID=UPI0021587C73|nr:helix-turn-helix transcriptional regulator [Christensenella minuta]